MSSIMKRYRKWQLKPKTAPKALRILRDSVVIQYWLNLKVDTLLNVETSAEMLPWGLARITYICMEDEIFCCCFDNTDISGNRAALSEMGCLSVRGLHKAVSKLEALLSSFPRNSLNDPLFTMVFDEVHGPYGGDSTEGTCYCVE